MHSGGRDVSAPVPEADDAEQDPHAVDLGYDRSSAVALEEVGEGRGRERELLLEGLYRIGRI